MRRGQNAEGIKVGRQRAAQLEQAGASPALQSRQRRNAQVHSTGTEKVARGRSSSRMAETNQVKKPARRQWRRPSQLPYVHPDAIPGFRTRYTRIDGKNRGDRRNLEARLQEGWEFVRHDELPKYSLPDHTLTKHGSVIGNDDMVLMKLHEELVGQRNAEYQGRTRRQTQGVLDQLKEMGQKTDTNLKVTNRTRADRSRRLHRVAVQDD